jgi:uncharacterized protein (TIGR02246 family)
MIRKVACFLVCAMLALVSLGQTAPATRAGAPGATTGAIDDAAMAEIHAMRNALVDAFNKGDLEKVLSHVHPEVVATWANAEVSHGHEGIRAYYNKMMSGPDKRVHSLHIDPKVEGRKLYGPAVLISFGSLNDEFHLTDGSKFNMNSRFSSLLVNENGKWLIKGFHSSGNLFDNAVLWIYVKKTATWTGIIAGAVGLVLGLILMAMFRRKPAATVH